MTKKSTFIDGTCEQLLFSPKGGIEGALILMKGKIVQVTADHHVGALFPNVTAPGKPMRVLAALDRSPKAAEGAHPVYLFEAFADADGDAIEADESGSAETTIKGVVAALHFARHGQPNGVILETGEFIHLRPQGMEQVELAIGSKVNATGTVSTTLLGTRLLNANKVIRIDLG